MRKGQKIKVTTDVRYGNNQILTKDSTGEIKSLGYDGWIVQMDDTKKEIWLQEREMEPALDGEKGVLTTHQLAKRLLAQPDVIVVTRGMGDSYFPVTEVKDILLVHSSGGESYYEYSDMSLGQAIIPAVDLY